MKNTDIFLKESRKEAQNMKRLIAALLTVAMTISIVPFSAFADESGADALLGEAAVESTETQQEDIPLVPENTDDLFQQNDAQEQAVEEQTQQAEVDTSDVSLTATNSFGQLLVNSMGEQNGASGEYSSRITGLKLNGHTATVEFVTDQDADLVVAVYTDSDAEEMVASGTVKVEADNNEEALVEISEIALTKCTVKAYLLDVVNHAPLCETYIKTIDLEPTPEPTYEVTISLEDVVDEGIVINEKMEDGTLKKLGETDEKGILNIQLKPGKYIVTATVQDKIYSSEFEIVDKSVQVELKAESEKPAPEPDEPDENIVESGKCGESLYWKLDNQGKLTISGSGKMTDYLSISSPWAKRAKDIIELEVEEGAESIGAHAFCGCNNLKSVTIPDSVLIIEWGAFSGCDSLVTLEIPKSVKKIGKAAFSECKNLTGITLSEGMINIEDEAFSECKKLTNINLPSSIENIGKKAFYDCASLKSITIPNKVKEISECTFLGCGNLENIKLPDNVMSIENEAFSQCFNLKEIIIPDTVSNIGKGAFYECHKLSTVKLPSELTKICKDTFYRCSKLTQIEIPDGVTEIQDYAFDQCYNLKSVKLSNSLKLIGKRAFWYCLELENITIPEGVEIIGESAFSSCKFNKVTLPDNVTCIEENTFYGCSSLEKIAFSSNVTTVESGAFAYCSKLKEVDYTGTKMQWEAIMIKDENKPLLSATIHCMDGDIIPASTSSENSVATGSTTANNGTFCATFDNVSAGKDYAVIISRSTNDLLNADNLIYINQVTADVDGELSVPFRTGAGTNEMTYIVACAQDDVIVDPDQPTEPDVPSDDDSGSSSGGGDGAGAAVAIIGGVVAVAAVAGVVMLMPVEVSGTVKNAEQAILPGVSVQVLQGDTVVAQTITDEAGHFTVKVRRGDYTLNVSYTDTDGQLTTKTINIKAPSKNMDVAA